MPGVTASRSIAAPAPPPGPAPAAVVLAKAQPWPTGCLRTTAGSVCSPLLTVPTEEQYGFDHTFTAAAAGPATVRGQAVNTLAAIGPAAKSATGKVLDQLDRSESSLRGYAIAALNPAHETQFPISSYVKCILLKLS